MTTEINDHAFYKAGVGDLGAYLLSDELFWALAGKSDLPRLTVGGLLLARKRLSEGHGRSADLEHLDRELTSIHSKWKVAWERKSAREFRARLNLWKNYLNDYRDSPAGHANEYPQRVKERVVLHLLAGEFPMTAGESGAVANLDGLHRMNWAPGKFVWEQRLVSIFPAGEYWFLYGKLKSS